MAAKKAENLSFEEALNELEQVVAALEQGNLPLEDALARFERGIKAARSGRERLEQAQQRIQQLIGDGDQAKLLPFASTGDGNDA
ncbi:MAG: exodeoxyribonuclease VII small subunit [Gammaproteobacteria bacterium]|nr:exodeoxyribonuclease VII small subunit [Gammaproteobacteria bacterium]